VGYRPDNRLADAPIVPVACARCGARVLARKSSWAQTSVQWDAAALSLCRQKREAQTRSIAGEETFVGCTDLRDSILEAVARGRVPVVNDETAS